MAIKEGPARLGERGIRTEWPVVAGLTAGTTTQEGNQPRLIPEQTFLEENNNKQKLID